MAARLDVEAMRALKAVVDLGGVTRAAGRLGLSQSAVSHKIRRLEDGLGRRLLSRRAGAPLLTDAGERLLEYAERIVSIHDEAVRALSKRSMTGRVALGVTEDTGGKGLARILARFANLHPGVAVRTHVAQSLTLQRQLGAGEIDLAIVQVFEADLRAADAVLYRERLHWAMSPDLRIDPLRPLPFLSFDEACFYRKWATDAGAPRGWRLETVFECPSAGGIRAGVEAGLGVALLNESQITGAMRIADDLFGAPPVIAFAVRAAKEARGGAIAALMREIAQDGPRQTPPPPPPRGAASITAAA